MTPEQRWAPFPVQDWSTMPPDPAWAAPEPVHRVPSAPGRPWWVPLVVLLCVGLVIASGTWLARLNPAPRTAALAYVPADGDALWQQVETTRENDTTTTTRVTESARFDGIDGLISGDSFLVTRVLHTDYDHDPSGARLWRTTTTSVDDVGVPTQYTAYHRVRDSVELAGEQTPDGVMAYEPALVELPAQVGPGSTWTGSGSAGDALDYTSAFRAAAGRDGCLDVSGELDLRAKGTGQTGRRVTLTRSWCPGRGLVDSSDNAGDVRTVATAVAAPAPGSRPTTSAAIAWTDPKAWTPRTWGTVTVGPDERTQPTYGSAETAVTPVLTASGLVVRALRPPDDLVATTPKTADAWTPAWSVHPGGVVLSLAAFGSVVLATTSERELVAYSDAGMRLWERRLPEIGASPPTRVSGDDAVLVDLSGHVLRFGIADGATRWEQRLSSDVNRAPAVGAGLVVLADRGGTVTALDAASGAVRWDESYDSRAVAVVSDRVLVAQEQTVVGLDPVDGRARSVTPFPGQLTALVGFAGSGLVVSKDASLLLDTAGRVRARMPGYLSVDVTDTHVAGWTTDRLDVLDPDGATVATWSTPATSVISSDRPGLVTPQGVYLFGYSDDWTFGSWTTGG